MADMTREEQLQAAHRLCRYDWQDWTASDVEDAAAIVRAFAALATPATAQGMDIDALAYHFWSIHPKDIPEPVGMPERYPGGARAWFYANEMRKLVTAQGVDETALATAVRRFFHYYDAERADAMNAVARAIDDMRAALATPAPWAPPPEAERPDGYSCVITTRAYWDSYSAVWDMRHERPTAFAPLPAPGDANGGKDE